MVQRGTLSRLFRALGLSLRAGLFLCLVAAPVSCVTPEKAPEQKPAQNAAPAPQVQEYPPQFIHKFIQDVETGSRPAQIRAAAALTVMGPAAVEAVRSEISGVNGGTAPIFLGLVARTQDKAAIPFIVPLTNHADERVAYAAVECLGRLGEVSTLNDIVLDTSRPLELRIEAVRSMGLSVGFTPNDSLSPNAQKQLDISLGNILKLPIYPLADEAIGTVRYAKVNSVMSSIVPLTHNKNPFIANRALGAFDEAASLSDKKIYGNQLGQKRQEPKLQASLPVKQWEAIGAVLWRDKAVTLKEISAAWSDDINFLGRYAQAKGIALDKITLPARRLDVPDAFRLSWVEGLLERPANSLPAVMRTVLQTHAVDRNQNRIITPALATAQAVLSGEPDSGANPVKPAQTEAVTLSNAVREAFNRFNQTPDPLQIERLKRVEDLLGSEVSLSLGRLFNDILELHFAWERCFQLLTPEELVNLKRIGVQYFNPDHNLPTDVQRWVADRVRLMNLAPVRSAELNTMASLELAVQALKGKSATLGNSTPFRPVSVDTPLGKVAIYGPGPDHITEEGPLLLDLGGSDVVNCAAGSPARLKSHVSIHIDLSGDDRYAWGSTPAFGAGFLGTGALIDLEGNDEYHSSHCSQGAAFIGTGVLFDGRGDDSFRGRSFSQGAAFFGVGLLINDTGSDYYHCGIAAQGFGGVGGFGALIDYSGDDHFQSGGVVLDRARKSSHFLSMSQGFGMGQRFNVLDSAFSPLSGGVGLLLDWSGNDVYDSDVFGQGAGYYFGAGILVDGAGNDRYSGYNYTQGAGIHSAFGMLLDISGDDSYYGAHHSLGNGLDRGAGVIFDLLGDDEYIGDSDCLGAGVKPYGFGLFIDHQGKDVYTANVGFGYARTPEYWASQWPVGLFLDRFGDDRYASDELGWNNLNWYKARNGLGVDGQ